MDKKGTSRSVSCLLLLTLLVLALAQTAFAGDGWHKRGKKIYYTQTDESGGSVRLTGLQEIGGHRYLFSKAGNLRTGWVKKGGRYYYGRTKGRLGKKGRLYSPGFHKVFKKGPYLFDQNGALVTGLVSVGGDHYYFSRSKTKGVRGVMLKSSFVNLGDGRRIYLLKTGKMAVSRWVKVRKKRYYLGEDGNLLRSTVTPDGWKVNAKGVRTGKAETDAPTDKATLRAAGTKTTTGKASVLILCGHGQGDSGALGMWKGKTIQEQAYTRDFGTRIYQQLLASGAVNVDLFNKSLDTYQQHRNTLNGVYIGGKTLQSRITGSGTYAKKTYQAIRTNGNLPDPLNYDYILEVHFDASGSKDYGGDGRIKGTFMYVNQRKSATRLDAAIISALHGQGLPILGATIWRSEGLLNARVYQEIGVNYGLLETCFIDDKDDMTLYHAKRDDLAKAVAGAIVKYFS